MPHTILSHTADTGIEATAPTLISLVEELATGMFELMAPVDPCPGVEEVIATVEASTIDDLVLDSLAELLYLAEAEDLHLCRFEVEPQGESILRIRAVGLPTADAEPTGPPIKAVTYHRFEVSPSDEGWYARVYFDV